MVKPDDNLRNDNLRNDNLRNDNLRNDNSALSWSDIRCDSTSTRCFVWCVWAFDSGACLICRTRCGTQFHSRWYCDMTVWVRDTQYRLRNDNLRNDNLRNRRCLCSPFYFIVLVTLADVIESDCAAHRVQGLLGLLPGVFIKLPGLSLSCIVTSRAPK